jgi:hypothetical protein
MGGLDENEVESDLAAQKLSFRTYPFADRRQRIVRIPDAEERASRDALKAETTPASHCNIYTQFGALRKRCFFKGKNLEKPIFSKEYKSNLKILQGSAAKKW